MAAIVSYRDLDVYRAAFRLQQEIYSASKLWPREERYALTDQVRRASRSVGANLAEAWQKRRYEAHFVSKLTDADAELNETRHWIDTARACGYIGAEAHQALLRDANVIGKQVGAMIRDASSWCRSKG
ncbi:MAG: four helix bundle protein [Bacteroidota bacterium]